MGEAAAFFIGAASVQYERDPGLFCCDEDVLRAQIKRRFGEGSVARSMLDFMATFPDDVSGINVLDEYRLLKLDATATELATRLATGQHGDETDELLGRYRRLLDGGGDEDIRWRLEPDDFDEDSETRVPVWPKALNRYIGGGVLRGHNITVYGRPDSGKSMFALNQAANLIRAGYRVLYVANEEPEQDITRRLLARLSGTDVQDLRDVATVRRALDHVREDYQRWFLFHRAGATISDIRRVADKVKPDVIIVDQLKNIAVDDDNRALQLDKLARQVRELGISSNAVTISVTQAGESANGELHLGMGDIEWSNTGIPGAADLLVGIGVNDDYMAQSKRMLNVPKNKVNGVHGALPVWVAPQRTAFLSKPARDNDE